MRIVSLAPSITETIFALNADSMLVGVTDYCNYPKEAKLKTSVGSFLAPDLSAIIELSPDILITTEFHKIEKLKSLVDIGVKVYRIEGKELLDAPNMIKEVGKIIGAEEKAYALSKHIEDTFVEYMESAKKREKVVVCYLCTSTKFCNHKPKCQTNKLVSTLGGELTAYNKNNLAQSIFESKPEVIIIPYSEDTEDYKIQKEFFDNNPILKDTSAYMNGRFYSMNGELLSRPGPRAAEGFRKLFELIHS